MLNTARIEARIPAQDLARARRWYAERLGLEPVEERDGGLRYEGATGVFCLFASAGTSDGSFTQMGFYVDDIEGAVANPRARGAAVEVRCFVRAIRQEFDRGEGAVFSDGLHSGVSSGCHRETGAPTGSTTTARPSSATRVGGNHDPRARRGEHVGGVEVLDADDDHPIWSPGSSSGPRPDTARPASRATR
jgi:catechol 2,3-dioxygenase-like lactoylglutathione lyase family enzyme